MFIYKITNLINNKIYIGLTKQKVDVRFKQHIYEAFKKEGTGYLHRAIVKYSPENFKIEQIDIANNKQELENKEKYYIRLYSSNNRNIGYNLANGGYSNMGYKHSEESKIKMSKSKIGKKRTPEQREKLSILRKTEYHRFPMLKELAMKRAKEIIELDENNNIINTYESISDCSRYLNCNRVKLRIFLNKNNNKLFKKKYKLRFNN